MGLTAKTNQLAAPAAIGSQAVTDPGLQPMALLMWHGLQTATGASADAQFTVGVGDSSGLERAAGYNSDDNLASARTGRHFRTGDIIRSYQAGTAVSNQAASLVSQDASGFTLNWGDVTFPNALYNYLAIGGSDITNTAVGSVAAQTTGTTQSVTGLGFTPDIVFLFCTLQTTNAAANNINQYSFGVMTASGQWAVGQRSQNAQAIMNTNRTFATNRCLSLVSSTANTEFDGRSFASMDADGFTLNINTQGATGFLIGYLAIKGGQWKVGTETQKTSTGTKSTTGVGFTPIGAIFAGHCDTATGITDHARLFLGATTGASQNTALWTGDQDNAPDSIANTIMSNSKCVVMATEATAASPTTNAEAALSSFDADGFTLDWSTADATARLFGYVAFGATGGGSPPPTTGTSNLTLLGIG